MVVVARVVVVAKLVVVVVVAKVMLVAKVVVLVVVESEATMVAVELMVVVVIMVKVVQWRRWCLVIMEGVASIVLALVGVVKTLHLKRIWCMSMQISKRLLTGVFAPLARPFAVSLAPLTGDSQACGEACTLVW